MSKSIGPMEEEIREYKVHSCCHACVTCGGTVTMRMHPSYLEQIATDTCTQQKSIRYYADINIILEDTDCCGKKSFLIHEVTNLPFRLGTFCAPIESWDQKQLEAFLTDLKARTAAAKFKRPMGEVMERE